jgi:hypothetical protein
MKKQELNERGRAGQHFKNQECKKEHKETWKKTRSTQVSNAGLRTETQPGSCRKRGKANRKR